MTPRKKAYDDRTENFNLIPGTHIPSSLSPLCILHNCPLALKIEIIKEIRDHPFTVTLKMSDILLIQKMHLQRLLAYARVVFHRDLWSRQMEGFI